MPGVDFNLLPNFFLIGAAKAGTTTLHNVLSQHPGIFCSKIKEPNFFSSDERFALGLEWYQRTHFANAKNFAARGESTATTLYWGNLTAPRLITAFGKRRVKILAIFRDPVKRAYSHYWQQIRNGYETLSFDEALANEEERLQTHSVELQRKGKVHYGYYRGGCYASLLKPFLDRFSREDFAFILLEEFQKNFTVITASLENFLGVQASFNFQPIQSNPASTPRIPELDRLLRQPSGKFIRLFSLITNGLSDPLRHKIKMGIRKVNSRPQHYQPMNVETEHRLRERYHSEIENLEVIMERKIDSWKTTRGR